MARWSPAMTVAIRTATRHPDRVTALVLTADFAYAENRLALLASVWTRIAASGNRELLAEFLLMPSLGTQALEMMPTEQLRQTSASSPPARPTAAPNGPTRESPHRPNTCLGAGPRPSPGTRVTPRHARRSPASPGPMSGQVKG